MSEFNRAAALTRQRRAIVPTAFGDLPVRLPSLAEFRRYCSGIARGKTPAEEAANDLALIHDVAETPEGVKVFESPEDVDRALSPEECLEAAKAVRDLMRGVDPTKTR